jgi:FkbM family methyltransferase
MKIFIDVGGHIGQTLNEVLSGKYCFDKVYCFEPMPYQYYHLIKNYTEIGKKYNLEILPYGLLDNNENRNIYGTNNDMAASIYKNKIDIDNTEYETLCKFVNTSEFFEKNIKDNDLVVMKLNCEGSEVNIIYSLLKSGQISKIGNMMIDFDIRKVPGLEYQAQKIMEEFSKIDFTNYSLVNVMVGDTHENRIGNWLKTLPFYRDIAN